MNNPLAGVELPKHIKTHKTSIGIEGMACLLEHAKHTQIEGLVSVICHAGMRLSEARALTWDDIDFADSSIRINKGLKYVVGEGYITDDAKTSMSRRKIELTEDNEVWTMLRGLKAQQSVALLKVGLKVKSTDLIFSTLDGKCWGDTLVQNGLKNLIKSSGVNMANDWRDLRHLHATVSLLLGEDVKQVSRRLGHASVMITYDIYADYISGSDRKASANLTEALAKATAG